MAAAKVFAIAELVQDIVTKLHDCGHRDRCNLPPRRQEIETFHRTHHDPSLVTCLRVSSLWFQIAKHILWANIPSIQLLSQIKRERRQIYANSIKSLQMYLPYLSYGEQRIDKSGERLQAHLESIRNLSFPNLHRLYIIATRGAQLSIFSSFPFTAEHIFVRFTYRDPFLCGHLNKIQEDRLNLGRFGYTLDYGSISRNERALTESWGPELKTMVGHIDRMQSLKGLSFVGYPECDEKIIWDCILKKSHLESLEVNLLYSLDSVKDFPSLRQPNLSRVKRLRVDYVAADQVSALLGHTRALEDVHLGIEYANVSVQGEHFPKLWDALSLNKNLRRLDVWFSTDPDTAVALDYSFALEEKFLMLFSDRCKGLRHLALFGLDRIRRADDVLNDDTLSEFSRKLPKMEVFVLSISLPRVTHRSLISMSRHWPLLKRLEIRAFTDLSLVTERDFYMPNLERLHIGVPSLVATPGGQFDLESSRLTLESVFNDLCPQLQQVRLDSGSCSRLWQRPFRAAEIARNLRRCDMCFPRWRFCPRHQSLYGIGLL